MVAQPQIMAVNWTIVFNRIFKIIDRKGEACYYSGPRYVQTVQEIVEDFPNYQEYMDQRTANDVSTTRRDYFKDILLFRLDDRGRYQLVTKILKEVEKFDPKGCEGISALIGGGTLAPVARIPPEVWNSERLNEYLNEMDVAIAARKYERTVMLAYTCLEGFFKAFVRENVDLAEYPNEITELAREVKNYLKAEKKGYPDEILNLITQSTFAINKARDYFSDAHFGGEAGLWLATYMRDLVNIQIRLLLHFM